jgi:hypothetical protein
MSFNGVGWVIAALFGVLSLSTLIWTQVENKRKIRNNLTKYENVNTDRIRAEIQSVVAILRAIDLELVAIKENQREVIEILAGFFDRMEVFATEKITEETVKDMSKLAEDIKRFRKARHI